MKYLLLDLLATLDVKCRKGCSDKNMSWVGFQNGDGEECGEDIERIIDSAKKMLLSLESQTNIPYL